MKYYPGATFNPGTTFDNCGVASEPHPETMHMTRMYHPMKNFTSLDEFKAHPYQELREDCVEMLIPVVNNLHDRGLAAMGIPGSIWEYSWCMCGMEDMMEDDEKAVYYMDKQTELVRSRFVALARAGVDFIPRGDDIGMQHSIMK
ncbi:MAG: hypothetical protein WCI51_22970 [Lentisphaerota bacterium]